MNSQPPYGLLAELTHRCPLQCVYCSNPLDLVERSAELTTEDWHRVLDEAAALGVVQVHLSGGEPLARPDVVELVEHARRLGLFTNLITSGVGFTVARGEELAAAGLNSVQLSVQGDDPKMTELVAKAPAFDRKRRAAEAIRQCGLPLSMNAVLHRLNLDRLAEIIDLAAEWGAERLELANTQYYGWALRNRRDLLPTREQLESAEVIYRRRSEELRGRMELIWILPDYHERFPKPCMGGWAARSLTVAPDGTAYPCPVASTITTLNFPSVRDTELSRIWHDSPAFNAYRGQDWMPEPCRSCDRRDVDFGGCRCQAFELTGDASRTDPVCVYSPDHHLVADAVTDARTRVDASTERSSLHYRRYAGAAR
ncbi:MAG: pyrroloquinoline quinone biosynthesis protein PqqE [Propionibacteriales bacterium]|nr:pyrroloquinoline quinone biosynthesis protein PqqE [Propionibacteriales bacterium]